MPFFLRSQHKKTEKPVQTRAVSLQVLSSFLQVKNFLSPERVRFWHENTYTALSRSEFSLEEKLICDWLKGVHFHAKIVHIQDL